MAGIKELPEFYTSHVAGATQLFITGQLHTGARAKDQPETPTEAGHGAKAAQLLIQPVTGLCGSPVGFLVKFSWMLPNTNSDQDECRSNQC